MSDIPSDSSELNYPAFQVPLDPEELATIGLIAVVWGQIDTLLDQVMLYAHEIDENQKRDLLGDTRQFGSKLDLVAKGLNRISPKETRAKTQLVLEKLQPLKSDRNALFHGCWGFKYDPKAKTFSDRATLHHSRRDNPFRPARLQPLLSELTECSRLLLEIFNDLKGWPQATGSVGFTWGGGPRGGGPSERQQQLFGPFSKGRPSRPGS